ncbi:MAG: two-component system LytT family response regulator [Cyclobacteriaceae bacterium]|jgi:two-component system LytT family response regulator
MNSISCIIIEDEPEFMEILNFYLKKIPEVKVLGCYGDTVQATLEIERKKPDFIFLDINISGLEGPEFVELLDHQPKIIVLSGHSESFMKHYPEVSYVDFIQKPPTLERIKSAIQKCSL